MSGEAPLLTADDLRGIASERRAQDGRCPSCGGLSCKAWEALPGGFDARVLEKIGTLRDPAIEDPTLDEHHPDGTHAWSPQAPIAPRFHPYNRSDVWRCPTCHRAFLRYTEYGGYYNEPRIREVTPSLVVDAS
jgi:hypothetical protein